MEKGRETREGAGLAARPEIADGPRGPAAAWPLWTRPLAAAATAALSAVALFAAFPPWDVAEAAYIWAIPLIVWILVFQPRYREVALVAFGCGWAAWFALIIWLRHFAVEAGVAGGVFIGWSVTLLLSAILALFLVVWALALRWVFVRTWGLPKGRRVLALLGLAGLWVVLEWVRSWILTGFPWLPLAASQWQRPLLLQPASVTGAWGVSFLLIFFNFAIVFYVVQLLTQRRGTWYTRFNPEFYTAMTLLALSVFGGLRLGGERGRGEPVFEAAFIQPYARPSEKWDRDYTQQVLDDLARVSQLGLYLGADVIVWPEAPTPFPVYGDPHMRAWVEDLVDLLDRPLLMGNIAVVGDRTDPDARWYNAVFVAQPERGLRPRFYAKRRLVPFGEYVPFTRFLPFLDKVVPLPGSFHPGEGAQLVPLEVSDAVYRVGSLICFEDIFPGLARESVRAGANFLFVATNNTWFREEAGAYQHAAHSVLRAVETRRPVLRVGNAGWSGWIDEFGGIRHVVTGPGGTIYFQGTQSAPFAINPYQAGKLTPYVRFGDWFVALSALLGLGAYGALRNRPPGWPRRES